MNDDEIRQDVMREEVTFYIPVQRFNERLGKPWAMIELNR